MVLISWLHITNDYENIYVKATPMLDSCLCLDI